MSSHMIGGRKTILEGGCVHSKAKFLADLDRNPWPHGTHFDRWMLRPCRRCRA